MQQHSPVDEDVAAAQPGRMDEIVAERKVLREILVRSVGRHHAQIVLVLQERGRGRRELRNVIKREKGNGRLQRQGGRNKRRKATTAICHIVTNSVLT
jgi:hypothetical protein